jgi:cell division FtsZ-interacting protein ZapD
MDRDYPNIRKAGPVQRKRLTPQQWRARMAKDGWVLWSSIKDRTVADTLWVSIHKAGIGVKENRFMEGIRGGAVIGRWFVPAWTLGAFDDPGALKRAKKSPQERRSLLVVAGFKGLL